MAKPIKYRVSARLDQAEIGACYPVVASPRQAANTGLQVLFTTRREGLFFSQLYPRKDDPLRPGQVLTLEIRIAELPKSE